jgi:hypothetical protein
MHLTHAELDAVFRLKHGDPARTGSLPRLWYRLGYFVPDDYYEAVVARLVTPGVSWLDTGCGRDLFPTNAALARLLAGRCGLLVGVDPDDTLDENPYVHRRVKEPIERFRSDRPFEVVTLRMVAEHLAEPDRTLEALAGATRPGSKVVVYTVNQWSPLALLARLIPFRLHHALKRAVWRTEERDTFPVAYRMNTRRRLARLFGARGFRERDFRYLDDCRVFARFRYLHRLELGLWRVCKALGVRYPENCLLGVYERV